MAKARDRKLDTKTARAKLPVSGKPYFRAIDKGIEIGYRKGQRGGKWVLRRYLGGEQYQLETFASADDDPATADGTGVLDFFQAVERARELSGIRKGVIKPSAPLTVKAAIDAYLETHSAKQAKSRLTKHVLSDRIAKKTLSDLSEHDLVEWRKRLSEEIEITTVRRIKNDFRAALNGALLIHRKQLPTDLPIIIRNGFANRDPVSPAARAKQILPDADIRRIIAAAYEVDAEDEWDGDLARMIITLAATGARFSQLIKMRVVDVQTEGRLMVPVSSKGRGEKRIDQVAVRVGEDVIAALRPILAGRKGSEPLFERWRWHQVEHMVWQREARGPWLAASELTRPWALIVAKAELAAGTVPYALRHSSIVRGLRAGLPVRLVAALHDTSAAMIEAHYSAYIVDAMDELAARAIVPLTPTLVTQLRPIERARGK